MKNLTIGVHLSAANVKTMLDNIAHAERAGVDVAWLTCGGPAPDPLAIFAAAALSCETIEFGTCIIPTFPRHPIAMAQGALVVDQLAPGRLRLGIGPRTRYQGDVRDPVRAPAAASARIRDDSECAVEGRRR